RGEAVEPGRGLKGAYWRQQSANDVSCEDFRNKCAPRRGNSERGHLPFLSSSVAFKTTGAYFAKWREGVQDLHDRGSGLSFGVPSITQTAQSRYPRRRRARAG